MSFQDISQSEGQGKLAGDVSLVTGAAGWGADAADCSAAWARRRTNSTAAPTTPPISETHNSS
ncbi:hypothetical protein A5640_12560 [Mycobacterium asiaticum]|uniref:Uncharacterized protein n=1 Tax=Mycobacterium asiaticum TaxID=1790 RepID=A0A1A3KMM2_MYCAS|nr:hypothetical protein A5640_12560 [Mycobacterium asiaticum]